MVLGFLILAAATLATAPGRAALAKPTYNAGDHWVYVLQSSLSGLPGLNASQGGAFKLSLTGIAQVDITGTDASGVHAETRASGFLNGTFGIFGNTSVTATGSFASDTKEVWEGQDYLPVTSNASTTYTVDVSAVISARVLLYLWANATTGYGSLPAFDLGVGDSASTSFTTQLEVATTFSAFGFGDHAENQTLGSGTWTRHVLGQENVTVEAGTFPSYRLNESLGGFPGLAAFSGGANETAWYSNDVGNYVRRVAYANGTPVGEMRLKSYTYPVAPPGLPLTDIVLLSLAPIAAVILVVFFLLRRRKAQRDSGKGSSGAGPVGELPPKPPGAPP